MDPNNLSQKIAKKYECKLCDLVTSNKTDFNKHLSTDKHKKNENPNFHGNNPNDLSQKSQNEFECECGKIYKHKSTLCSHKKKCNKKNEQKNEKNNEIENYEVDNVNYKEMIMKLIEQNTSLQNTITEMIPKLGNNNNINNNSNNTINQNFNIVFFLNENCKDAISMNEFIKTIDVSVNDLLLSKDKGLIKGISNLFISNLNKLPLVQRPLWCGDKKRRFYI